MFRKLRSRHGVVTVLKTERRFAGIRLVGIFLPWQGVACILGVVVALTALVAVRTSTPGTVRVEHTSADESPETPPELLAPTTTVEAPATTTTSAAAAASPTITATTQRPTPPTAAPTPTTTTTIPPGSAEVVIFAGGVQYAAGSCLQKPPDGWEFIAVCPGQSMRPELVFGVDQRRYPAAAQTTLDVAVAANHDSTYCLRLFNLDRSEPVAGSEQCWTSPAVPPSDPAMPGSFPPAPTYTQSIGPVTLTAGLANYTLQATATKPATGETCWRDTRCDGALLRAKLLIEWG